MSDTVIKVVFVCCVSAADKVRTKSSSGRPGSPSLSVYATLRTPRTPSSVNAVSPLATSLSSTPPPPPSSTGASTTPSASITSTPTSSTSSRLYSPSLSAGLRAFSNTSLQSSPRGSAGLSTSRGLGGSTAAVRDGLAGKRPSALDQQRRSPAAGLRTNSPAAGGAKQIAALHSTFFQSAGHDVDF